MANPVNPADPANPDESGTGKKHNAGLLDIRTIIGGLLGAYGLILTLAGIFGDQGGEKTGGVNANLWAGLALLAVGAAFLLWARLRPVAVPETADHGKGSAHH